MILCSKKREFFINCHSYLALYQIKSHSLDFLYGISYNTKNYYIKKKNDRYKIITKRF